MQRVPISLLFVWMHRVVLISFNKLTEKANNLWKSSTHYYTLYTMNPGCCIWRECLLVNKICMTMHLHCLYYYLKVYLHFWNILWPKLLSLYFGTIVNNNKILWFILQYRRRMLFVIRFRFTLHSNMSVSPGFSMCNWTELNRTVCERTISHYLNEYNFIVCQMWRQQVQFISSLNSKKLGFDQS